MWFLVSFTLLPLEEALMFLGSVLLAKEAISFAELSAEILFDWWPCSPVT